MRITEKAKTRRELIKKAAEAARRLREQQEKQAAADRAKNKK